MTKARHSTSSKARSPEDLLTSMAVYWLVNAFLHVVNLLTSDSYWAIWPALGWGLALILNALRQRRGGGVRVG
ncbi:MAG: 2TM domain-containing protein [Rhodobacterales bacterium]|nr:2TM domain-containing protein [Rhodobacterales bacterium]